MERFLRYFVDRHLVVHTMVALVAVGGYLAATRLPRATFPNVTIPTLVVTATLPGAAARDVETKVTIPIQEAIEDLDGVKHFLTVVSDSTSVTVVELYDDFDERRIRESERDLNVLIDAITDFPPEMEDEPVIERQNPHKMPVIQVALAGPTTAVIEAGKLLERRLRRLDSVSRVTLVGLQDPEVRILVDPAQAREHGVTLLDVVAAVERRNVSSTGGMLETERDRRQVVLWSRFADPRDVADTILHFTPGGGELRIGDVARIEAGREDTGLIAHTGGRPGLSVVVRKQEDADIVDTADAVRALVESTPLPEGVTFRYVRDESWMTRNRLELMYTNGLLGAGLVALVLFAFLTPVAAIWVLVGIPVVFLGTLALFPVLGFSVNMVTLTSLIVVLGMVVDDAIVVSERIVTKRQEGLEPHEAATRGAAEMARPVLASAITTMLAFIPLWALGGVTGKLTRALPAVVVLALALSLFESFLILPAHMSMGRRLAAGGKRRFVAWLEDHYRAVLTRVLHHRLAVVVGFAVGLFAIFGVLAPRVSVMLFPQDDADALFLKVTTPLGTPIEQTEAVVAALERQLPGLMGSDADAVTARIGHQETGRDERERGAAENEAVITVMLRQEHRQHNPLEWIGILDGRLATPEGTRVVFEAEPMGPPVGQPVTVHVASNDDSVRRSSALEIARWLEGVGGVVGVEADERPGTPQIELDLDYARLARLGLDADDVGRTLKAAFHGLVASEHRDLDDNTDLRVLFDPAARRSLDSLLETPVRARSGELVRLRDVVTPVEVPAVARIYHRDGLRTITIEAQFAAGSGHTALSMADRLDREVFPRYAGVPGLEVENGGEAVETRRTTADLGLAAMLAVAGITVVIALMLGSFLEAAFVVAIVPFAVAGVILTFFLHRQPLSIFAMIGSVGLAGVVVNASIVMVDGIHRRLRDLDSDESTDRRAAVIDAVVSRLRPILVTTLTTLGGVIPMAYGIGGRDAVVAPMSLAIGWGLAFSTLVTLLLVPTLYTLASDLRAVHVSEWQLGERLALAVRRLAQATRGAAGAR